MMKQGVSIAIAILIFTGCNTDGNTFSIEGKPQNVVADEGIIKYPNTTGWTESGDGVLSLRFSSGKTEYVAGETIEVRIELRNNSNSAVKVESVRYALGSYGNALAIEGPVELEYVGPWKEYYIPPSEIPPGAIISDTTTLSVVHWQGLDTAGKYKMNCRYHSGNPAQDRGLWNGSIDSATLEVKVKEK